MHIAFNNASMYHKDNFNYHAKVGVCVQDILQEERLGRIGYIPTAEYEQDRYWRPGPPHPKAIPPAFPMMTTLPADIVCTYVTCEYLVPTWLLSGEYSVICLLGAMGSGKTALLEQVRAILPLARKQCGRCRLHGSFIDLDLLKIIFSKERCGTDPISNVVGRVERLLLSQTAQYMRSQLVCEHEGLTLIDAFVAGLCSVPSKRMEFHLFAEFRDNVVSERQWQSKSSEERALALTNYIDKQATLDDRLQATAQVIKYVRDSLFSSQHSSCCIIVVDNVDRLDPEDQQDVLRLLLHFTHASQAHAIIALRLTTFMSSVAHFSFSFGLVSHMGHEPREIVLRRLDYFINNPDEHSGWAALPPALQCALRERASAVLMCLQQSHSRLSRVLDAIAGQSVRRGLFVAQRLLLSQRRRWDDKERHREEEMVHTLISPGDHALRQDDDCVVNILQQAGGAPGWCRVRAVQHVWLRVKSAGVCTIGELAGDLRRYGYCDEDICDALTALTLEKARLLRPNTSGRFESRAALATLSNATVAPTFAGERYLRELVSNFAYVQLSLAACNWADEEMPPNINYANVVERLDFVRRGLSVLRDRDISEVRKYLRWRGTNFSMVGTDIATTNRFLWSRYVTVRCARVVPKLLTSNRKEEVEQRKLWSEAIEFANFQQAEIWPDEQRD